MKIFLIIVVVLLVAFLGENIYRSFLRPIDPLASEVKKLADHLVSQGINANPYAVRHGFRYSRLLSSAAFEIEGYPLSVSIRVYPSVEVAKTNLASISINSNIEPEINGNLIIDFPAWGDGTEGMAEKIKVAFSTF